MDKGDVAIIIALLSASFSAWQGLSGHVVAREAKRAAKRKPIAFEASNHPAQAFDGWTQVNVTARNIEPVSATITKVTCLKKGVVILPRSASEHPDSLSYDPKQVDVLPREIAKKYMAYSQQIGPGGSQESKLSHGPRATEYFSFFATAPIDRGDIDIEWLWADGQK